MKYQVFCNAEHVMTLEYKPKQGDLIRDDETMKLYTIECIDNKNKQCDARRSYFNY